MDIEILGELAEVAVDGPSPDYSEAKAAAKARALEISPEAMLLSWHCPLTGNHQPRITCGKDPRPAWIVWAASRGANLTVSVNHGEWLFYFLL